ncbi:MAG: hypothetical protein ACRD2A_26805, partial [Vicinamibacterales bacterium]
MSILVLESDPEQAATIRHLVCDVVGARLTLVESVDRALHALRTSTPDLILLPPLVSPAEEAQLLTFLRTHPQGAHVEALITPVLGSREECAKPQSRGWLKWGTSRTPSQTVAELDEKFHFAERLAWSLENARARRRSDEEPCAPSSDSAGADASSPETDKRIEMEEPTTRLGGCEADQRAHKRFRAGELKALKAARIKSGSRVAILDVSAGGALFETDTPLTAESEA